MITRKNILVKRLHPEAQLPIYKHEGDSGFNFITLEDVKIPAGNTVLVPTGLAMVIPSGYELQVRMRSGAASRSPLIVANAPGTVDSTYRGEIKLLIRNISDYDFYIDKGSSIAQGVIAPVVMGVFEEVDILPDTERGDGGFGSTGN